MATFWERARAAISAWNSPFQESSLSFTSSSPSVGDEDSTRLERYRLLWSYYHGKHRRHLKARMINGRPGPDDNVTINFSRRVVDKGINFLFGKPLTWQLNEAGLTEEEILLERIWGNAEQKIKFLSEVAQNGGVTGDFYIQIVPPQNDGEELPRLVNLNPSVVFVKTDPNDISKEWAFELRYHNGSELRRTIHALREDTYWETWEEIFEDGNWRILTEPELWPFTWPMVVHGKNLPNANSYHGTSDLEDADINDSINMVASNINRITRIFAHPMVWAKGFGKNAISADSSQMFMSDDPNAEMGALELGRNLSSSQEFLSFLRTAFAEVTGVPQSDPERLTIGAQSGFALKVLFNDLVLKTGLKRGTYGSAIIETNRRLLDLMDRGENRICRLYWRDPLPVDERIINDGNQFELDNGLASHETVASERGRDWQIEVERIRNEKSIMKEIQQNDPDTDAD